MSLDLGTVGLWTGALDSVPVARAQELAAEVEELGFGTLWIPEAMGRNAMAHAALLGVATRTLVIATGIANIYARDAMSMNAGYETIADALDDRFLLGLGVSHQPAVEELRGQKFRPPLKHMADYLDAMDSALFLANRADTGRFRVLGALGPKMLALARQRTHGAHTYCVNVEHTARARDVLGPDKILAPECGHLVARDLEQARPLAQHFLKRYLALPNYANNLRRLGFRDADLEGGGSDRLIEQLFTWGDIEQLDLRVQEHLAAGATHVCVQVITPRGVDPWPTWRVMKGLNSGPSAQTVSR